MTYLMTGERTELRDVPDDRRENAREEKQNKAHLRHQFLSRYSFVRFTKNNGRSALLFPFVNSCVNVSISKRTQSPPPDANTAKTVRISRGSNHASLCLVTCGQWGTKPFVVDVGSNCWWEYHRLRVRVWRVWAGRGWLYAHGTLTLV